MGNSCTKDTSAANERRLNRDIEKDGKKKHRKGVFTIKVLLLGTGESGKSTIFKQARTLFGKGFNVKEYEQFRPKVFNNILSQLASILEARRRLEIPFENPDSEDLEKKFQALDIRSMKSISPAEADLLQALWHDEGVQKTWFKRASYQVFDCISYFLSDEVMARIASGGESYIPTFQDIVQCRDRTTGIILEKFTFQQTPFEMYDVGGQRSERRKWLSCFDNVTTIIYVTAINEYDQVLFEEHRTNRVDESLRVWRDIVNRGEFRRIGFVLFLNKMDLFKEKVVKYPYKLTQEEAKEINQLPRNTNYMGKNPMDFPNPGAQQDEAIQECYKHMEEKFMNVIERPPERTGVISEHATVATETDVMKIVFDRCQEQILTSNLVVRGFVNPY